MAWEGSTRRQRLPADWPKVRARILERDGHRCTWIEHGERCPERATEVDHVIAGDDHRDTNLASRCHPHHARKSAREGYAAGLARQPVKRPTPPHPGLKGGG